MAAGPLAGAAPRVAAGGDAPNLGAIGEGEQLAGELVDDRNAWQLRQRGAGGAAEGEQLSEPLGSDLHGGRARASGRLRSAWAGQQPEGIGQFANLECGDGVPVDLARFVATS